MTESANSRAKERIELALRTQSRVLDLSGLGLKEVPLLPAELAGVQLLNLSSNRLKELPPHIWKLADSKTLDVGNNQLSELPRDLGRLANLESLDASENLLTKLPLELGDCYSLRELHLYSNQLTTIVAAPVRLERLAHLDACKNRLRLLPGLDQLCVNLVELDLSSNQLERLPSGIAQLHRLEVLILSGNRLNSVNELASLRQLRELYLDGNLLSAIPTEIAGFDLQMLSADRNPFGRLPPVFDRVSAMTVRDRARNAATAYISGGPRLGERYADAPVYQFDFSLAVRGLDGALKVADLYYKTSEAAWSSTLTFPDGHTIELKNVSRKTALNMIRQHEEELTTGKALLDFGKAHSDQQKDEKTQLAERVISNLPLAELIPKTGEKRPVEFRNANIPVRYAVPVNSTQPPNSIVVTRTPHMDVLTNTPLKPAQQFSIRVYADRLEPRLGEQVTNIAVLAPAAATQIDLEVWIAGTSHFEFSARRIQPFTIDLQNPDHVPTAEFSAEVRRDITESAVGRLTANFTYQGRASGQVSVEVLITVDGCVSLARVEDRKPPRTPVLNIKVGGKTPDLTIEVRDPDNTKQHLHCTLSSPHLSRMEIGEPFTWKLDRSTEDLVKGYMSQFVDKNADPQGRLLSLKGAGRNLWNSSPPGFQATFWKLFDLNKLDTILIVSDEPYIPWELMVPRRPGTPLLPPIGAQFTVGRWLPNDFLAPQQRFRLSRSLVVAPRYVGPQPRPDPLPHAADEARLVLATVTGDEVDPATLANLQYELAARFTSLVHFVCHGSESDTFGQQIIELDSGQWTSLQAAGMDELGAAFKGQPLVFLNACEIGRLSTALVGVGGFAKVFIDAGAGAVIAPLWSVKDSIAHEIAEWFYRRLKSGRDVRMAEIFRDIRRKAYVDQTAGEDTYAAYCFYGDPNAVATILAEGAIE